MIMMHFKLKLRNDTFWLANFRNKLVLDKYNIS